MAHRQRLSSRVALLACAAALCGVAGCGLSEYESRMDQQAARLKVIDEENKYLGSMVDQPAYQVKEEKTVKTVNFWPFPVYLRVPRGFAGQVHPKLGHFKYENLSLFLVAGPPGQNVYFAAGNVVEKNKEERYKDGEWPAEYFRAYVREALIDANWKQYQKRPGVPSFARLQKVVKQPPPSDSGKRYAALEFEAAAFFAELGPGLKEQPYFQVYFLETRQPNRQAVVIFEYPAGMQKDSNAIAAVDWSLKTFDISPIASSKRSALERRLSFGR